MSMKAGKAGENDSCLVRYFQKKLKKVYKGGALFLTKFWWRHLWTASSCTDYAIIIFLLLSSGCSDGGGGDSVLASRYIISDVLPWQALSLWSTKLSHFKSCCYLLLVGFKNTKSNALFLQNYCVPSGIEWKMVNTPSQ